MQLPQPLHLQPPVISGRLVDPCRHLNGYGRRVDKAVICEPDLSDRLVVRRARKNTACERMPADGIATAPFHCENFGTSRLKGSLMRTILKKGRSYNRLMIPLADTLLLLEWLPTAKGTTPRSST
jgi:hypothetical protein